MEAQTDLQSYLEQGKQALAQGKGREAAIAYAHSAQLEPANPMVHLGLAEANLALGNYSVVQMACQRVQELQPQGGLEAKVAQALLDLLDRRYERALHNIDAVVDEDPSLAYAHALRGYLLRANGQDYDGNLARARAMRISYGGRFDNCFPPIETPRSPGYGGTPPPAPKESPTPVPPVEKAQAKRDPDQNWSRPNRMQRQMIRTRFALSRYPTLITTILIAANILAYIIGQLNPYIYVYGVQDNSLVLRGEVWRILTAMFLHDPTNLLHIALNMLSLFFIGRAVEIFYGKWRYLTIYFLSGIFGGIAVLIFTPNDLVLGASGAIFGVFGAIGVFYLVNRRALGSSSSGAISSWIFWLVLNLAFGLAPGSNISIWDHIGGLIAGIIIAYLLIPRSRRGRMMV